LNTLGERSGVCASVQAGSSVKLISTLPLSLFTSKARRKAVRRSTGSLTLPYCEPAATVGERASSSSRIARTTAFMSPRTPLPLLLNTAATRAT
jgi:hypothetical protein